MSNVTIEAAGYRGTVDLKCTRCRSKYELATPLSPRMLRSTLEAFEADHETCEPVPEKKPRAIDSSDAPLTVVRDDLDEAI